MKDYKFNKKMAKQRAKRGFSDDMCWGMYNWFLETFPKMIINLRDMKHGYPELDFEEIEKIPISWIKSASKEINEINKKDGYDEFDIEDGFNRWQLILTRIAYCLTQADEDTTEIKNEYQDEYFNQVFGDNHQIQENETFRDWWNRRFEKVESGYIMKTNEPSKELEKKYFDREKEIYEYRNKMKDEAFDLLKKYFWDLWD